MKPKQDKQERLAARMTKALKTHPGFRPPPEPSRATEKILQEVWRLWNLLPSDWPAECRASFLKISRRRLHRGERARLSGQLERLAQEPWDSIKDGPKPEAVSADFLKASSKPLGREYHGAIDAAAWWHEFAREDYPVAVALREQRGDAELFNRADNVPGADEPLVAWRTGRELIARKLNPLDAGKGVVQVPTTEFWKLEAPPLALVNLARCRWQAYREAHIKARHHFAKISWPLDFDDLYTPADAYAAVKTFGDQVTDACKRRADELLPDDRMLLDDPTRMASFMNNGFWKMHDEGQKEFLLRTHRHSQHWKSALLVAMRHSAGMCSQAEFAAEMNCVFPQLSLDEKIKFTSLCRRRNRPEAQLQNRRALLCAWAEFNAPVFREFRWHRDAVYAAAIDRLGSKDLNKKAASMFEDFSRKGIKMNLPKDREHLTARPYEKLLELPPLDLL